MYHRVQTNEYAVALTYRQRFSCNTWDNLAGPIPAPRTTRFVVRSDKLLNSTYFRSATGAERPILIPSIKYCRAYAGKITTRRSASGEAVMHACAGFLLNFHGDTSSVWNFMVPGSVRSRTDCLYIETSRETAAVYHFGEDIVIRFSEGGIRHICRLGPGYFREKYRFTWKPIAKV